MTGKDKNERNQQNAQAELDEMIQILRIISRSLGVLTMRLEHPRPKTKGERALFLNSLGFDRNEISNILAVDPKTISVHLSQQRKSRK